MMSDTFSIGGDLPVRRLGFGSMRLTGKGIWGEPRQHGEAIRVLRRAMELGINFIDTADSYGPEVAERLIAEALHPYPADLVIATKAGLVRPGPVVRLTSRQSARLPYTDMSALRFESVNWVFGTDLGPDKDGRIQGR